MKLKTLLTTTLTALLLVTTVISGMGQAIFTETFNYTTPAYVGGNGAPGTTSNGWTTHSVTGVGTPPVYQTTTIDVQDGSLSYTGLAASVGNKVLLPATNTTVSRDINAPFTTSATVVYYSALINVVDASQISATAADYFISLGSAAGTSAGSLAARLGIKSVNAAANFRLSIGNTSGGTGNPTYTEIAQDLSFGTTYLVVVKYDRSVSPNVASLWVNPATLGGSESIGSVTNASGTTNVTSLASICLRNSATTPKVEIDEIRVGTTFADVTPVGIDATAPVATFAPAAAATNVAINSPITITFDEAIRNIDDSPIADPTSLITLKETDASGAAVAFTAAIDVAKKVVTITPAAALKFGQAYYMAIAPVEDAANNATATLNSTFSTVAARTGKLILTYALTGQTTAPTIGDGTIAVEVASTATVASLVATFTISDGASVKVGAVNQVSATTINDFTTPVTYVVTAEDGTTKDWVVTVTKAATLSDANDITAFSLAEQTGPAVINAVDHTVTIEVANGTIVTTLIPTITVSVGAGIEPGNSVPQNFTAPVGYTVTAENTTPQLWTVTVTIAAAPATLTNTTTLAAKYYAGDNLTVTWTSANMANVKVEWFDGSAWSEVAASVPATDGQYAIAIPAATKYGVAYKFRISNAANAVLNAESSVFTVIAVVNNITEFKALTPNDIAKIKGEVVISFIRSANRNQKYIQDAAGGLLVDDPTPSGGQSGVITTAYAEKDGITGIEGKLVMFGTFTYEIVPTVDPGAKSSSNNTVTPKVITLVELKADHMKYQSMLVKVQGVTIKEATGTAKFVASSAASNYTMQLATEEAVVRQAWKAGETDLIDAVIPVGTLDIVGIVGQFTTGTPAVTTAQLQPRRLSDIVLLTGINDNDAVSTKAYPNPFGNEFKINAGKVVRNVTVSNMLGQKVMERAYSEAEVTVTTSDLRSGIYLVNVKFEDGTATTLRMVKK